jgi:hypothetical protein
MQIDGNKDYACLFNALLKLILKCLYGCPNLQIIIVSLRLPSAHQNCSTRLTNKIKYNMILQVVEKKHLWPQGSTCKRAVEGEITGNAAR